MVISQDRARLRDLLTKYSVRRGEFTLASGAKSNIYVDARVTACRAEAMPLIGKLFLEKMAERGWAPQAVGGLTMGADPIAIAVARESLETPSPMNAFLVRKEAKGHGTKKLIEGLADATPLEVVIVDDTCTSGGSTIKAIEAAREAGHRVLGAICLVDREEGARENIEVKLGCPFERVFTISEL